MGLTDNQKQLIVSIAEKDYINARLYAGHCLDEDTTSKNKFFCSKYSRLLKQGSSIIELPCNLKSLLQVEDQSQFQEGRYYLSDRELSVFNKIVKTSKVCAKLAEMKISYVNSTLLWGESGTGKTTFGRYVAYRMGLPFYYLRFSNLVNSYMGETSKNISKVFEYAKSVPCVFMLDELDCISIRRSNIGSGGTSGELARVTITIMQELDLIPNNMILIAATNRIDRLDEAILSRFSIKHEVTKLNKEERYCMAKKFFLDIGCSLLDSEYDLLCSEERSQRDLEKAMIAMLVDYLSDSECV